MEYSVEVAEGTAYARGPVVLIRREDGSVSGVLVPRRWIDGGAYWWASPDIATPREVREEAKRLAEGVAQ